MKLYILLNYGLAREGSVGTNTFLLSKKCLSMLAVRGQGPEQHGGYPHGAEGAGPFS